MFLSAAILLLGAEVVKASTGDQGPAGDYVASR